MLPCVCEWFENERQKCILSLYRNINTTQTLLLQEASRLMTDYDNNEMMLRFSESKTLTRSTAKTKAKNIFSWKMEKLKIGLFCPVCKKSLSNKGNLAAHRLKFHDSELVNTYPCVKCDKIFEYKRNWRQHYINKHSNLRIALNVAERNLKPRTTANKRMYIT